MATLASSSSILFTSHPSSASSSGARLLPIPRLSLSSFSFSTTLSSSSLSISPFSISYSTSSRPASISAFTVRASAAEKKKVLIVNTNSGGHAIIGFCFAKQLLGSGHEVTIFTVGEETSDKMKKPPFNRFSVKISSFVLFSTFTFQAYIFICVVCQLLLGFQFKFAVLKSCELENSKLRNYSAKL